MYLLLLTLESLGVFVLNGSCWAGVKTCPGQLGGGYRIAMGGLCVCVCTIVCQQDEREAVGIKVNALSGRGTLDWAGMTVCRTSIFVCFLQVDIRSWVLFDECASGHELVHRSEQVRKNQPNLSTTQQSLVFEAVFPLTFNMASH